MIWGNRTASGPVPCAQMLSVIIPTHDSERQVVRTLACLVAGATSGLIREVILADGGSRDETEKVADIAGCRFASLPGLPGARLAAAAKDARGPWLMFLRPGSVLDPDWVAEVERFLMSAGDDGAAAAAVFRPAPDGMPSMTALFAGWLRQALGGLPKPEQGLLLTKAAYKQFGGHAADARDPETQLLRRIGRRNITLLHSGIAGNFR
jgi:glycosyltransferase involved in cell wall biosynthesis